MTCATQPAFKLRVSHASDRVRRQIKEIVHSPSAIKLILLRTTLFWLSLRSRRKLNLRRYYIFLCYPTSSSSKRERRETKSNHLNSCNHRSPALVPSLIIGKARKCYGVLQSLRIPLSYMELVRSRTLKHPLSIHRFA